MSKPLILPKRQGQMLRGLYGRQSKSREYLQTQLDDLQRQKLIADERWKERLSQEQSKARQSADQLLTEWDELLEKHASEFDRGTYNNLLGEREQKKSIEQERVAKTQHLEKQHEQLLRDAENDFQKHKDEPRRKYEKAVAQLDGLLKPSATLVVNVRELVQRRGYRVQHVSATEKQAELESVGGAQELVGKMHGQLHRSASNLKDPLAAKVLEGVWLYVMALAGGVVVGLVTLLTTDQNWLYAGGGFLGGCAVTLGIVIGLFRSQLQSITKLHYPQFEATWSNCQLIVQKAQSLAHDDMEVAQEMLLQKRADAIAFATKSKEDQLKQLTSQIQARLEQLTKENRAHREQVARQGKENADSVHREWLPRWEQLQSSVRELLADIELQHRNDLADRDRYANKLSILARNRLSTARELVVERIRSTEAWLQERYPDWVNSVWNGNIWERPANAPIFPLGHFGFELPDDPTGREHREVQGIEASASSANASGIRGNYGKSLPKSQWMPLVFQPLQRGGICLEAPTALLSNTDRTIRNLVMRALTSLPPGKLRLTIIDPRGLGRDYSWLMHLADYDPKLVSHRVWTEPAHISQQLSDLVRHSEQVIQQLLRDRFKNLHEYNAQAGSLAEPFHIVLWPNFPFGCDEIAWKNLTSLLQAGSRCGVTVCLQSDSSQAWPAFMDREFVNHHSIQLKWEANADGSSGFRVSCGEEELSQYPIRLSEPPEEQRLAHLLQACGKAAVQAGRVEIPLAELMPKVESRWTSRTDQRLEIPIGQSGPGRVQNLRLGVGTAQHALIAGKTGSGKSTLLHTLITSAALRFSPNELRMVLLDFKKGVEFQVYAEGQLPHADIIGIESQREFGISALEYLDRCMQVRGELFREVGVQDIPGWTKQCPDRPMPRILLVIDEFQELFVQDDKLAQQASLLLDRVVRQGRSFGIHAILASQTLAGAYSLPRTTLGQMGVRIALQCDPADATVILGDDNMAASRLTYPGQAIYNDAGGRVEGNQAFQVAWCSTSQQSTWFGEMPPNFVNGDESTNTLGRQVIFEGHKPSAWDSVTVDRAIDAAWKLNGVASSPAVLGDSVAIRPATAISLPKQAGRNLLLVGADPQLATRVVGTAILSQYRAAKRANATAPQFTVLNGGRPNDAATASFVQWLPEAVSDLEVLDVRATDQRILAVADEVNSRQEAPDQQHRTHHLVILQMDRFRNLKRGEEFSFGSDDGEPALDKKLAAILRDGPSVGVHTWIWCDSYSTVSRWLSRNCLNDLEVRIVMQMSSNDSNHLIDSGVASQLGAQLLLVHDDAVGQSEKFRPMTLPTLDQWKSWIG